MATTSTLRRRKGATLPNSTLTLQDDDGNVFDPTGYTLAMKVGNTDAAPGSTAAGFTKSTGLTVSGTNVVADWASSGEIGDLAVGTYQMDVTATTSGEHLTFTGQVVILPAVQ